MINNSDIKTLKELDLITQKGQAPSIIAEIKKDIDYYKELKRIAREIIRKIVIKPELKKFFEEEEKEGKQPYLVYDLPLNIFNCKIKNCKMWIYELEGILKREVKKGDLKNEK